VSPRVERDLGRLDVLVNNAGISGGGWSTNAVDADLDEVRQTLETNLFGAWRLTEEALPLMRKNGYGRIVNISSGMGQLSDMGGHSPAIASRRPGSTSSPECSPPSSGTRTSSSTRCARAGCAPTWALSRAAFRGGGRRHARVARDLAGRRPRGGFFRNREPIPW
jgi:NAD(P)-dependent dehydrogenase (short-subunit alcohol dehydrogenase family)